MKVAIYFVLRTIGAVAFVLFCLHLADPSQTFMF